MKRTKGYTLLEMTVSFGLMLVLITAMAGISRHVLQVSERVQVQSELFHQASVSMEFIAAQIESAQRVRLDRPPMTPPIADVRITVERDGDASHLLFRNSTQRLYFGGFGNEVSRYIARFYAEAKDGLLTVSLTTTDTITTSPRAVEAISLARVFDISTKFSPID